MIRQVIRVFRCNVITRGQVVNGHNIQLCPKSACRLFATKPLSAKSEDVKKANHAARVDLAVSFRALEFLGLNEGVDNHLSLMAPALNGHGDVMLVNPYGYDWTEITASNLIGMNSAGEVTEGEGYPEQTAVAIHMGVREVQPTATECIMHTHMPYATSLGILKDPTLRLHHQGVSLFLGRIAYDYNYQGVVDAREEGRNLAKIMGDKPVLMMCNHGVLTTASTLAMALYWMFLLERCSMFQILAMSTGKELREYPEEIARKISDKFDDQCLQKYADIYFTATKRKMLKKFPDILN